MPPPEGATITPLAERLAQSAKRTCVKSTCQTCVFMDRLPDRDRAAVSAWAAEPDANMAELHRECASDGLRVTYRNFLAHFEKGHHLEHR